MLSQQEQLRFSRQTMLKGIGEQGQQALKNARILIVGVGGLGNPVSLYLNAAGVGNIYLADGDNIDISNLHRQILFKNYSNSILVLISKYLMKCSMQSLPITTSL